MSEILLPDLDELLVAANNVAKAFSWCSYFPGFMRQRGRTAVWITKRFRQEMNTLLRILTGDCDTPLYPKHYLEIRDGQIQISK